MCQGLQRRDSECLLCLYAAGLRKPLDADARLTVFADFVRGLAHLHGKGVMHRDISPSNLGLATLDPPKGLLLDLDAAVQLQDSNDHMKGNIPFLAPEIIALKNWDAETLASRTTPQSKPLAGRKPPRYTKSVDVWALGLSLFVLETAIYWSWKGFNRLERSAQASTKLVKDPGWVIEVGYQNFQQHLQGRQRTSTDPETVRRFRFVERMTKWDAIDRVLIHQLLDEVELLVTQSSKGTIQPKKGRKRRSDGGEGTTVR